MRRSSAVLVVAITGALTASAPALAQEGRAGEAIPGQYIVVAEESRDAGSVARWQDARQVRMLDVVNGFAAELDAQQVRALRKSARVDYVEADRVVTVAATQTMDSAGEPWGLDRIDQRSRPGSRTYSWTATGAGVTAYVVDTGIATAHTQFGGRAANVYDAFGGNGQDCHGHGTHVAGTIGAATWGVAKGVTLRGVRVLNCSGRGSTSGIIAALNWIRTNGARPAVANMSLGGGFSSSLNSAATNLSNAGVFLAVAAGNESQNACNVSPASASGVFTTAASDRNDRRASFSNYGSCVEAYAPGVAIRSTWLSGGINTISGTSMASPHVAGVGALYKQGSPGASSASISNAIISGATTNVITSNPSGTPNRLLYKAPTL
ncbi:MAG TPA: S8 family peptidase [Solirubrobacteraceae bacterium]|nr:S8 family peptidase [Solirubrobacteraceae bacterium]